MTLADLFNAPVEFTLGDEKFLIAMPTQLQQGEYQRWLEQLAFEAIDRRTYQSDDSRLKSVRMHDQDCAAGVYEWGGELSIKRIQTQKGLAKLVQVICREQGMTDAKAAKLVDSEARKLIQVFRSKVSDDPKVLAATLETLGPPSKFFLSLLLTHPLISPSDTSAPSPTTSL